MMAARIKNAEKRGKPFKRGNRGRPKGAMNVVTREARDCFRSLLEANQEDLQRALNYLKRRNPAKFIDAMMKLAEFCVPKLTRTHITTGAADLLPPPVFGFDFEDGGPGVGYSVEMLEHVDDGNAYPPPQVE